MKEPESDVRLSKNGENKGIFSALRMLQAIVNNEMFGTFPNIASCHKLFWREVFFCSETY